MKKNLMGLTDVPIDTMEHDLFQISPYVEGLTNFINVCETPMTISIQGDWGTGKTSMMHMLEKQLQDIVYPIWFNTWQFSQFHMGNTLAFSMLDVLIQKLGDDNGMAKHMVKIFAGIMSRAVKTAAVVTIDSAVGGEAANIAKKVTEGNSDTNIAKEIMQLKDHFQEMVDEKLKKEHKSKVVVFIDDLDRLDPEKAVELLEVLKIFLDCENCVFILAVDYEVISLGIRQKYGDLNAIQKGKSFFDKIIQLPFKMPVAHYTIRNYVQYLLQRIQVELTDKDIDLYIALIQTSIGFNPRSIKRLFNIYQLLDFISKKAIPIEDVAERRRLLFAVVCLQTSFEDLYSYLSKGSFTADTLLALLGGNEQAKAIIAKFLPDTQNEKLFARKLLRLQSFLRYFLQALNPNADGEQLCSDEDIEKLKIVLQSSSVTAVGGTDMTTEEDLIMENILFCSAKMKEVVHELNGLGNFVVMPLPINDNGKRRIVASARNTPTSVSKLDMDFTCDSGDTIAFNISMTGKLGLNPLTIKNVERQRRGNTNIFTYNYRNLFRLNKNNSALVAQTVKMLHFIFEKLK